MSSFFFRFFIAITFSFLLGATAFSAHATTIVALGDSLVAGYGLKPEDAFPAQLEARLKALGKDVTLINGGVSGDTSAGGKSRLNWVLEKEPQIVIVALGANDMLRGVEPTLTHANLDSILQALTQKNIVVVFAGMKSLMNMGPHYAAQFNKIYPDLTEKYGVIHYPFFLEGVAQNPELNLADGAHPNAAGVAVMVNGIMPSVLNALDALPSAAN
jgi:acyl-CoA thioesterase-1